MQIKLKGKRLAVEKLKKQDKKGPAFLSMPNSEEYFGVIRYVSDSLSTEYKVGQQVYFGNDLQNVRMGGFEVCVMEDDNVLAVVEE